MMIEGDPDIGSGGMVRTYLMMGIWNSKNLIHLIVPVFYGHIRIRVFRQRYEKEESRDFGNVI